MSFVGLNTAYTGLVSAQIGLDTTSHNVANSGTEGYTRQRIDQSSRRPLERTEGFVGQGLEVHDVRRARDAFLDARYRAGSVVLGSAVANAHLLARAEASLGEPDDGLTVVLDELFDAFEDLALSPDDESSRVTVLRTIERFADRANELDDDLDTLADDAAVALRVTVDEVNQLVGQVAALNDAITEAASSQTTPNDLLDERDRLLDELARRAGVAVTPTTGHGVRVSLQGMALVDQAGAHTLSLDTTTRTITHDATGIVVEPGGELGGIQRFLRVNHADLTDRLDAFVADVVSNVNSIHAAGYSDAATPGGPLLSVVAGEEAGTVTSLVTDPVALAAAATGTAPFARYDGDNARALAGLRTAAVAAGGTDTLGGTMRSVITQLGATVATAQRAAGAQDELVAAADLARDAAHGVNLDEEMVLLLQYQRSYQAASRVITTVDQTLDVLINRTGIVGR